MYFTGTANAYEWNPRNQGSGLLDNLGAASIVAVDTPTAKCHGAMLRPGDPFDYDVPQTPMVITIDGKKMVVQPGGGRVYPTSMKTMWHQSRGVRRKRSTGFKGFVRQWPADQHALTPRRDRVEIWPSLLGGVNMYPNAYSPKTGKPHLATTNSEK
jgi:hypothetical protein